MDQTTLTNKTKAILYGVSSAAVTAVGYGILPSGTPQVIDYVGAAVLAVITAVYAVKHLLNPTA
jgi:hypothetical protein